MSHSIAQTFMDALQQTEKTLNVAPLVALFAERVPLENPARSVVRLGKEGAAQFWGEYLSAFERIRSEFTSVHEGDGFAALEWRSEGRLSSGEPVSYRGLSLIEWDATNPETLTRFCTYYDSATFLPSGSKHSGAATALAH